MPYKSNQELPTQLKKLPAEAQTIFRKAFNASFQQYGEERARKIAWSAVKKVFEKKEEKWVKKEKLQAFVNLDIDLMAFSQEEIIARIPNDILEKIKEKDEHPFFQMYSIAHEGISSPKIEGKGHRPIVWLKSAIQTIKKVIKNGIKFFDGHNKNIDNPDKPELGEVIYSFEEEINNKLNYCVIGYFPSKTRERAKEMDICSQESQWELVKLAGGKLLAETCNKITGIALGNSRYHRPAFENAKRLAMVQAFDKLSPDGESSGGEPVKGKTMTFTELKEAVKKMNVMPHQLYTSDEIKGDREFGKLFDEISSLNEQIKTKEEIIDKIKQENSDLNRKHQLQSAKGILEKIYKENNLTDNIKKFVSDIYEDNKSQLNDITEDGLKKFVEIQTKVFQKATGILDSQKENKLPTGDEIEKNENPFVEKFDEEEYL